MFRIINTHTKYDEINNSQGAKKNNSNNKNKEGNLSFTTHYSILLEINIISTLQKLKSN